MNQSKYSFHKRMNEQPVVGSPEYYRNYYELNREKYNMQAKLYYELNKEKISQRKKLYYLRNKERISERRKMLYQMRKGNTLPEVSV